MLRIDVDDLLIALASNSGEGIHFLDRESGAVIMTFGNLFQPGDPEYVDVDELLDNPRYIAIEPVPSREAFRWMERFAASVADPELRDRLDAALRRKRPFRGFRDVLLSFPGEEEDWFAFQEARQLEVARDWLRSEGIEAELISWRDRGERGGTPVSHPIPERPPGALLYSERLRILRSDCPVCGAWEEGTGWLIRRENAADRRVYVEMQCTGCGSRGGTWRREWAPLIDELLDEAGGA